VTGESLIIRSGVPSRQLGRWRAWLRFAILGVILMVAATGFVFAGIALLRPSALRVHRIQMTTNTIPLIVLQAEQIRAESAHHRLDVVLTAKEYGTLEALEEVNTINDIQFALVAGGVTARTYEHVRSVTTLSREYLHLLVKPEFATKGIAGLRGKRIAFGPPTSASYHVARDVLSFAGLLSTITTKSGEHVLDPMTPTQALRELTRIESLGEAARSEASAQLPDAFLFLAPLPSLFARRLVTDFGYTLVPLPFAEAYELDRLNPPSAEGVLIDRALFTTGVIPAYTYSRNPPEPAAGCPTICVPLVLIAEDDADPDAVSLLLETIYESPLTNVIRPPPLSEQVNAFPRHPGTERYLHRKDPLLTPEVAARMGTLVGGTGAFLSGMIALYGFLRLRNLGRFEAYYHEIGEIEMLARGLEEDPTAPTDPDAFRADLERRLTTLKCKVLEDFAEGGLKGEGLMAGIIALINDTRESLAGMATVQKQPRPFLAPDEVVHP
jgi:TRAP-type uncharacterized transport system substrate-binding protein